METGKSETGEILGSYQPTGYIPKELVRRAYLNRVDYDSSIFQPDADAGEAAL